jgi:glycosyltransferase involved in cell wall biosynthesis
VLGAAEAKKLVFLLTEDWFFLSHFLDRALAARNAGFDVVVAANEGDAAAEIRRHGLRFVPIPFRRGGINFFGEIATLLAVRRLYRDEDPDLVHQVALKPILYGTPMAGRARIVNAPVGMGFVFTSDQPLAKLLRPVVRLLLRLFLNPPGSRVVLENRDDLGSLVADGTLRAADAVLIRGAGVDIAEFSASPEPAGPVRAVLVARMLRNKGVGEFVEAARLLRGENPNARFRLVGLPDPQNPTSLTDDELAAWQDDSAIEWLGPRSDIAAVMKDHHIVVLPSYREGLPKVLLEAMATGRPIVATDVPGCREAVADGDNGLLVPPRDAQALAGAIGRLMADPDLRIRMGRSGRQRAETEFATGIIVAQTLALYTDLVARPA